MAFSIRQYLFEGPYTNLGELKLLSGVLVVCQLIQDSYHPVYIESSENVWEAALTFSSNPVPVRIADTLQAGCFLYTALYIDDLSESIRILEEISRDYFFPANQAY